MKAQQEEDKEVTLEEQLIRRMEGLQQNIAERQFHLLRCIDDFEVMRNDLVIGMNLKQFDTSFDTFGSSSYPLQLTRHFLFILKRIQNKIHKLKRTVQAVSDHSVQVNLSEIPLAQPNQPPINKQDG